MYRTMEKEDLLTKNLIEILPLASLFPALDYMAREAEVGNSTSKFQAKENKKYLLQCIKRIFTCRYGSSLLVEDPHLIASILSGLFHGDKEIRKMTSHTLFKALERGDTPGLATNLRNSTLMPALVNQIADPEISVGQYSADALLEMIFQEAEDDAESMISILECIEGILINANPNSNQRF